MLQGNPCLIRDPVDDGCEALGKGTSPGILTCQPDRVSLHQQGADGQQLGCGPVNRSVEDLLGPAFQLGQHLRVGCEALWQDRVHFTDPAHHLRGDLCESLILFRRVVWDASVLLVDCCGVLGITCLFEHGLQPGPELVHDVFGIRHGDVPTADQRLGVEAPDGPFLLDQVVHLRLGETRVVALIVATTPVAD